MAQLPTELTDDFSAGMFDAVAPTRYPRASCSQILNGRIQPDGTVRRRWGSIKTSAAAPNAGTGFGATRFTTAAGTDMIFVVCGAKAYKSTDKGATWTLVASGLRQDYWSFATMRVGATNYLFGANGDTTVKQYDGSTWTTVSGAPSGVKYVAVFNGRLWVTGHSGVLVQASAVGDHTTWASPSGITVQIIVHSGDTPMGMYQVGPHLLVFDRHATAYIDGYGEQTLVVAAGATGFSRTVGCVGFRTVAGVGDNGVAWLSERGVEYYTPSGGLSLISKPVQTFLGTIDWDELYANPGRASATYDEIDQDYYLTLSTNGTRNNRVLVANLRTADVGYQRSGPQAAVAVDRYLSPDGGGLLFGGDASGYLTTVAGGFELEADTDGYMALDEDSSGGDPTGEDSDGYLETTTNDALPATLFVSPATGRASAVYSVGYDGFVRRHYNVAADDMDSDGTGGTDVTLTIISRPFLFKNPRMRKRARIVHVASLQESQATLNVSVQGRGSATAEQSVTMPAYGLTHASRKQAMVNLIADAPQVVVRTTDDVRVSLVGLSAKPMRERR